jgi:hypothetical protein
LCADWEDERGFGKEKKSAFIFFIRVPIIPKKGKTMDDIMSSFRKQETTTLQHGLRFNEWSQAMIVILIAEQEEKLLNSDMPVEDDPPPIFLLTDDDEEV